MLITAISNLFLHWCLLKVRWLVHQAQLDSGHLLSGPVLFSQVPWLSAPGKALSCVVTPFLSCHVSLRKCLFPEMFTRIGTGFPWLSLGSHLTRINPALVSWYLLILLNSWDYIRPERQVVLPVQLILLKCIRWKNHRWLSLRSDFNNYSDDLTTG